MSEFYSKILESKYPYHIAEIGSNHNGDMTLAKEMIDLAKECGADCVKFQSWTPTSLIAREEYDRNQVYDDGDGGKKHFGTLEEMVEKYYLRSEQHGMLKEYCDSIGIDFNSTPFSKEEVDHLMRLDVPFIKVASMDLNNWPLLKYMAKTGKPIVLSTGMATVSEIGQAVRVIEEEGNKEIVLLHCISIYPPEYNTINLNNIPMLVDTFGYPAGFSDHTIGFSIPLAAVAVGAPLIEKHFTLDKNLPGWDHMVSADPDDLKIIVQESRNIVDALGTRKRVVSAAEEEKKAKFRRSLVLLNDLKAGEVVTDDMLTAKRPGTGISPDEIQYVVGRTINCDKNADMVLNWNDFLA